MLPMVRVCGACTALLAFAVTILRGLAIENPTDVILTRALWMLVLFLIIGSIAGWIGQTVVAEHARKLMDAEIQAREAAESADSDDGFEPSEFPEEKIANSPEGAGVRAG
jgi:fructose-specific phosphotransferase system IIC component